MFHYGGLGDVTFREGSVNAGAFGVGTRRLERGTEKLFSQMDNYYYLLIIIKKSLC